MSYFRNGVLRFRLSHADGVDSSIDVFLCYTSLEFKPGMVAEEINSSCNAGTVHVPTHPNAEATVEYIPDTANLSPYLRDGSVVSYEICVNPWLDSGAATPTNQLVFVCVTKAAVLDTTSTFPGKGLGRKRLSLKGSASLYQEQVGRTGLPAPFNAA